jgi:transcriptional regulator with XRE-family HTH domain
MSGDDFGRNLRLLCAQHPSVADVCRQLGVNRQQFNKYLSGQTRPSPVNLRRICGFFEIEEGRLLLPHARFREAMAAEPSAPARRLAGHVGRLLAPDPDSDARLERYLGYYYSYYCSPSFPGLVRRSLVRFYQDGGQTLTKSFDPPFLHDGRHGRGGPVVKFAGVVFYQLERIFVLEQESLMKTVLIETILYPDYRKKIARLSGLTLAVAGKSSREPYASRIVYEFLGVKPDLRASIEGCGAFPRDDPEIDPEIAEILLGPEGGNPGLLAAVPA